jgi:hypothetical protein
MQWYIIFILYNVSADLSLNTVDLTRKAYINVCSGEKKCMQREKKLLTTWFLPLVCLKKRQSEMSISDKKQFTYAYVSRHLNK